MGRHFNVNAVCRPGEHYMVDISDKLRQIKAMIDAGKYFTINRARQYGKTTTLQALRDYLKEDYAVIHLDFQMLSYADFETEAAFAEAFVREILDAAGELSVPEDIREELNLIADGKIPGITLSKLFKYLISWCGRAEKPLVLLIDETDHASDNRIFLSFLSQLRGYYMNRTVKPTFQSVILAGVYDIRNLKDRFIEEKYPLKNSPWNIAADFEVNMSFSKQEIAGMLQEYERDYETGMDVDGIAGLLYDYTSGYPYLVSRLCMLIDEKVSKSECFGGRRNAWTRDGFLEAERMLLMEKNPLFESLVNKLTDYPELEEMLDGLLFSGRAVAYNSLNPVISVGEMFGFLKERNGMAEPANRIFDTLLYNYFLSIKEMRSTDIYQASLEEYNQFVWDGHLNMRRVLEKFTAHFHELYGDSDERFVEEEGRKFFLLYLRPIINGTGNYYVETRTRGLRRTDVIVDYRGERFIVEMKIWRGEEYHKRGEQQLAGYLEDYNKKEGYLLSFNFNKKKQVGVREVMVGDKKIIEAVV